MKPRTKTIMIQGTGSGVGKSVVAAAFCRIFLQDGYKVAPFKSQNMALNSFITSEGAEMGRAQAMQAEACGIKPSVDMNPVLIKPTSEREAQIILKGRPWKNMSARQYHEFKPHIKNIAVDSFNRLKQEYEVIVIEGAGSPAEVNLRDNDIVNMSIAQAAGSPVVLAGDIDKGGVFAWLWGTIDLLKEDEKERIKALLINKFRGDLDILKPGLEFLEQKTGKKILGVIPYFHNISLDEEDTVASCKFKVNSKKRDIKIEILYLPHISNFTDFDALEREFDVSVKYIDVRKNEAISDDVDVLIIPGSKSTIADMLFLREKGYVERIKELAEEEKHIIGICGGYQMLGKKILDSLKAESRVKQIEGAGLLDIETVFEADKITRQSKGAHIDSGISFEGYEIHMGRGVRINNTVSPVFKVRRDAAEAEFLDGAKSGNGLVWGTYLHGIFDNSDLRRYFINQWRIKKGLLPQDKTPDTFSKDEEYDKLAELVRNNIDEEFLYHILKAG